MVRSITQTECVTYMQYVEEIRVIEQCCRKNKLERLGFIDGQFVKFDSDKQTIPTQSFQSLFNKLSTTELEKLKDRVSFINTIHHKLEQGAQTERTCEDCSSLVVTLYKMRLQTITAWNKTFEQNELHIDIPSSQTLSLVSSVSQKTAEQVANEKETQHDKTRDIKGKWPILSRSDVAAILDLSEEMLSLVRDQ